MTLVDLRLRLPLVNTARRQLWEEMQKELLSIPGEANDDWVAGFVECFKRVEAFMTKD